MIVFFSFGRRGDRTSTENDRICSCHFKDGRKDNGPTMFPWNRDKHFDFPEVERKVRKRPRTSGATATPTLSDDSSHEEMLSSHDEMLDLDDVDLQPDNPQRAKVEHDHSYLASGNQNKMMELLSMVDEYKQKVRDLEGEMSKMKLEKKTLTIDDIKHDDSKMLLYTSLHYDVFCILVSLLGRFKLNYYQGWNVVCLSLEDQLLLALMKLRLGSQDLDLAQRFGVSATTVSNVFYTMLFALHELLFEGIMAKGMPSQLKCGGSMPASFRDFVSARAVMDATEISQDIPSNLNKQNECYSNYKSRHTVKAVTCVAPNAAITYVSELYPGSVSDVAIVEHSNLLSQFVPGDLILADKGFTLFSRLPTGVSLNIPPFLTGKSYFTKKEADLCFKIGKSRIHVERANERIKNFAILEHIPAVLRPLSTKIFQVCCCLVNIQDPLLKEIAEKYEM